MCVMVVCCFQLPLIALVGVIKCGSAGDVEVGVKSTFGLIFRTYHEVILSSLAKKLQIMAKTQLLPIFMWRFWPQSIFVKFPV